MMRFAKFVELSPSEKATAISGTRNKKLERRLKPMNNVFVAPEGTVMTEEEECELAFLNWYVQQKEEERKAGLIKEEAAEDYN